MSKQIRFATVSDVRQINEVFATLPETTPVHCCDTWVIKKENNSFNGGLIFFRESDADTILTQFERSKLCPLWEPNDKNDKNCIFIVWNKEASDAKHQFNQEIVRGIIDDVSTMLMSGQSPVFTDKESVGFISFKQGRGFVPAIIGALNAHPLLRGCRFRFAYQRKGKQPTKPTVERATTEELISHGSFNAKPRKLTTKRKEN